MTTSTDLDDNSGLQTPDSDTQTILINSRQHGRKKFDLVKVLFKCAKWGLELQGQQILYFSDLHHEYIFAGVYPNIETVVEKGDLESSPIRIRYRKARQEKGVEVAGRSNDSSKKLKRRANERRIAQAVDCVYRWKKLQQGSAADKGMTQQEAAKQVQVSKKTLDDYQKQIKLGRQYGFDFNYYRNSLVGLLRNFNTKYIEAPTSSG